MNIYNLTVSIAGNKYEGDLIDSIDLAGITKIKKVLYVEGGKDPMVQLTLPKNRDATPAEPIGIMVNFTTELSDFEK